MAYAIISTPDTIVDSAEVLTLAKTFIVEKNSNILLGEFPAVIADLDPKRLIGDPNENLSDEVCQLLAAHGVVNRVPDCDKRGRQFALKDGSLLWTYSWGEQPFAVLTMEELAIVAWDLRRHPHFAHVSLVADEVEETAVEVSPEEHPDPEFTEEELAGMPWEHVLPPDHPASMYYMGDED